MSAILIEKLVSGGYGLGRDDDGVVFIGGVMQNEVVEYVIDGTQGGARIGHAVKIVERSLNRREPPCQYFAECGGCDWLFMNYDEQTRCKKEIFSDCLTRIGKLRDLPDNIDVFTADEFGYRIRAQIKIDQQNKCAGFYRKKSRDVVKINKCPLLVDDINGVLTALNSGMTRVIPKNVKAVNLLAGNTVASYPVVAGLTNAHTEIIVGDKKFLAAGGSFFQSNKFLLETMGRWFANNNDNNKYKYGLDLYGGIGFFSLMLSDIFENITLVENILPHVKSAERNFRHNNKAHLKAIHANVDKPITLGKLTKPHAPDCVIVDPPRPGLTKSARKWLIDMSPSTILYISCNPSTFARDAGTLVNYGGYKLTRRALFDMYPNTHHIESAAVFCR